jgi:acyl-CoA synthetase (AMP-forming)/AMP-acid ligase II
MKGYLGVPNSETFDSEGYFKTGDLVVVDEHGYFHIIDRKKVGDLTPLASSSDGALGIQPVRSNYFFVFLR